MTLKLKSLLVEQPASIDKNAALIQILQTQRSIFASTLAKLESIDYSGLTDEISIELIRDNPSTFCDAYINYCGNILSTIKEYPNASELDVVTDDALSTFGEAIRDPDTGLKFN
jgi:hypothetical protein